MKIQNVPLSLVFFLVILILGQLFSGSYCYRTLREKQEQKLRSSLPSQFSGSSSTIPPAADSTKKDVDKIYGVSNKLVPGGPNPLHNK
ncbi:hypothetical protein ACHQM5_000750 [Ranunculus cassubicifolius]